jgi:hypothetical protein
VVQGKKEKKKSKKEERAERMVKTETGKIKPWTLN